MGVVGNSRSRSTLPMSSRSSISCRQGPSTCGGIRAADILRSVSRQHRPELLRTLILAEPGGELDTSFAEAKGLDMSSDRQRVPVAAEKIASGDIDGGLKSFVESINGQGTWLLIPQSVKQELRDNAFTLLGQMNEQRQPYQRAEAEAISVPTLFILGEKTQGSLPVVLRALAAGVRGSKTAIIANAPHHMIRQEPVGTSAAVLEFLAA